MLRIAAVTLLLVVTAAAAAQDRAIRWRTDVESAVAEAKKRNTPLMFYVKGSTARKGDDLDDLEDDQRKSFRDERCYSLSQRFICVQLSRTQHKDLIEKWGLRPNLQLYVVYVQPDGTRIDWQDPLGVATADAFAQKMARVFTAHRNAIYDAEIKASLDAKAPVADVNAALKRIREMTILSADKEVAALLDRTDLDDKTRQTVYDTLAHLSTRASVEALLAKVQSYDDPAAKALSACNPAGASFMLSALDREGPLRIAAYNAITKACRIKSPKPARFWDGKNEKIKSEELDRVRRQAETVIKRWREQYEEYR